MDSLSWGDIFAAALIIIGLRMLWLQLFYKKIVPWMDKPKVPSRKPEKK